MKRFNKYIYILFIFIFVSCGKTVNVKDELIISFENKLDKEFIVICETNKCSKQLRINARSNDSLSFYSEKILEVGSLETHKIELVKRIYLSDLKIYNLTDTTYSIYSESYYNEKVKEIYRNHIKADERVVVSEFNYVDKEYITIDSNLLPILKKDNTILETFKEYYK